MDPREPIISQEYGHADDVDFAVEGVVGDEFELPPEIVEESCSMDYVMNCLQLKLGWWSVASLLISVLSVLPAGTITENNENTFISVLLLLDYLRLPGGMMVVSSLQVGGRGLLSSFFVALILVTLWSVGGYIMLNPEVNRNNDCKTIYQCWYLGMNGGFHGDMARMHGDLHENLVDSFFVDLGDRPVIQFQWWFTLLFVLIWEFIISGIVQGQIVDAFAEIRQKEADLEEDTEDKCLVCSMDRFTLEQSVGTFAEHIDQRHNPWSYLFFCVYLQELPDHLEMGLQNFVTEHLDSSSAGFLPVRQCFDKQKVDSNEKSQEDRNLTAITTATAEAEARIIERLEQRMDQHERSMSTLQGLSLIHI